MSRVRVTEICHATNEKWFLYLVIDRTAECRASFLYLVLIISDIGHADVRAFRCDCTTAARCLISALVPGSAPGQKLSIFLHCP